MKMTHAAFTAIAALAISGGVAEAQGIGQSGSTAPRTQTETGQGATSTPGAPGTGSPAAQRDRESKSDAKGSDAQTFVREAAIGGLAEVELGQLASGRASSGDVKQFAERMVADHGKANSELKSLAEAKGLRVPTELDAKHKKAMDKLSTLSGAAFDRAYMDEMRKDHKKDVNEFKQQSTKGSDPEIKAWAATKLPILQEHMQMAERTHSAVATSGTKSSTGATGTGGTDHGGTDHGGGGAGSGATPGGTGSLGAGATAGSGTNPGSGTSR
jgi:putative membrane protein